MLDNRLKILSDEDRRGLLRELAEENPRQMSFASETDSDQTDGAVLYHSHLPKLEAAGYISWNRESNTVMKGPKFDELRPLLTILEEYIEDNR